MTNKNVKLRRAPSSPPLTINYNTLIDCPNCKAEKSVVIGGAKLMCFLCSWTKKSLDR